jgi:hypothetical protein
VISRVAQKRRRVFGLQAEKPSEEFEHPLFDTSSDENAILRQEGIEVERHEPSLEQVRRTAELLFGVDREYRQRVIALFGTYHPGVDVGWLETRPRQGDWRLCMISLGQPAATLPFFARCGLAKIYKELVERGHLVSFNDV